ncbi:D-alanyl-D-alanine carboxypeptidase family protein [Stappia albiluteola]|uniref:D-alanyl-D-alanine carboxypeptidase family protein n=1 Tax=Stappia albiluteola TaxID=2758565 RepID=UPI001AD8EA99|nr:D-alanyl-D-alanine carboxypeptidase family protein [Stappia albiluteola]
MTAATVSSAPSRADVGAWIVLDAQTGDVLDEKDATRPWYPASITKLMTAYVAFKAIREGRMALNSAVTVSANANAEPPSKMGFKVGTRLTLESALKMMLIKSANDIAVAVAESVGGTEQAFIDQMNAEAQRLGLRATHFVNPHGLPDNRQLSSARDLGIISMALWREFPEYRDYYNHVGFRFGKKLLRSANREYLQRVPGANGLKTGYICNSGYNVAVSATRGGRTVMAVILGAGSGLERLAASRELIDKGFRKRGGRSITSLTEIEGSPPPDGYCKSNPRLDAEELVARYGGGAPRKPSLAGLLSYGGNHDRQGSRIIPGIDVSTSDGDEEDIDVPKKGNKVDWGRIMDDIVGPRVNAADPIAVALGSPVLPKLEEVVRDSGSDVGRPEPKPAQAGASVLAPVPAAAPAVPPGAIANPGISSAGKSEANPGSIFRGTVSPKTPFPLVKPQQ